VSVPSERAEEARARLADLAPGGWEEREDVDRVELAFYVPVRAAAEGAAFGDLDAGAIGTGPREQWALGEVVEQGVAAGRQELSALGEVVAEPVAAGWQERWREFHRPVRVGPLRICPPWESAPDPGAGTDVVIDPGRAFGTGAHPTTRLCLELLLQCEPAPVADIGCGSGVLAIAAARLGFHPVVALDSDPAAVEATLANAAANVVEVGARLADALEDPLPRTELTLANLELASVRSLAARLDCDRLIASGFLASETPRPPRWRRLARRELGGWAAELLERAR
jgi:ribosomal protein L11 methyltransferase